MNITYKNLGFSHSIESILMFLLGNEAPFWSESILYFYPQIDKQKIANCSLTDRQKYITDVLKKTYEKIENEINNKVILYNDHFQKHKGQIEDALSDAFGIDAHLMFNDLSGNITMNPICPRFLKERTFDVFYMNSEKGAIGMSLHEVIHYFWFDIWNRHFDDCYEEYENPSLKWILSEMVVESIMSDKRLSSINPYFPRENGGCIYPYFQNMIVNGSPILHTIDTLYRQNSIADFMEKSYVYCQKYENEIRKHIEIAEAQ